MLEPEEVINFKLKGDPKLRRATRFEWKEMEGYVYIEIEKKTGGKDTWTIPIQSLDYICTFPDRNEKRETELDA